MASQVTSNPDHLLIPVTGQAAYVAIRSLNLHCKPVKLSRG